MIATPLSSASLSGAADESPVGAWGSASAGQPVTGLPAGVGEEAPPSAGPAVQPRLPFRTPPKCTKCGLPNTRGNRTRLCEQCLPQSKTALATVRAKKRLADCPPDKRWCTVCDEFLPPSQFSRYQRDNLCLACQTRTLTTGHRARKYGITDVQYEQLLDAQGGVCAICGNAPKKQRLHIDHHHKTGVIRGLLCLWCNHRLLGGARDSIDILRNAIDYLDNPPAPGVIGEIVVPKKRAK